MSIGKISSKTDIIQDPFDTGTNYTGVTNLVALGGGQPVKYGFILARNTKVSSDLIVGSEQVVLQLNPQMISQDEPASTQITYTQNAGKYIERRGQICKTISIQGTTGYTPTPKIPDAVRSTLPQSLIVQQEGPQSGLAQFIALRGLFRKYLQTFSDDAFIDQRKNTLLIWVNGKDDEQWVVEPLSFRMDRASPGNKFTYQYSITLQTIAPVEAMVFDPDILTDFQKVSNRLAQVTAAYNTITAAAASLGNALSTVAGTVADAMGVVASLCEVGAAALGSLINGTEDILGLGKVFFGQVDDVKNSYMGAWNQLLGVRDYVQNLYGVDPLPFDVHATLAATALTMADIAARQELFSVDFPNTWGNTLRHYTPDYGWGGYNQDLVAPLQRGGVQETTILPGDTLQNIAVRELGNAERVMELVVLNQLKPPFLSPSQQDRSPNTLAPGDPILIPSSGSSQDAGPRALVRTTVFSDPNLTTIITGFNAPNQVFVDTRGRDFRLNQWAGFTIEVDGPVTSTGGGAYVVPAGTYTTTLETTIPAQAASAVIGIPQDDFAALPDSGYLIFDTGNPVFSQASYKKPKPNLIDAVNTNISTCTDGLRNTSGFTPRHMGQGYNGSSGGATLSSTTDVSVQGAASLNVTCLAGAPQGVSAQVPCQPNTQYIFLFQVVLPSGTANMTAQVSDNSGMNAQTGGSPTPTFQATTSWTQQYVVFTTGSTASMVELRVGEYIDQGLTFSTDAWALLQFTAGDDVEWNSVASPLGYLRTNFGAFIDNPGYGPGQTPVVYSADGTLPTSGAPPPQALSGPLGVITSNDSDSLTLDTNLAYPPTNGDIVRIYLVRSPSDLVPLKSSQEQLLGVDLALANNDLQVDAAGRLQLIESTANVMQAVQIKLRTRQGDLAAHPTFGLAFDPGTRVSPTVLFNYKVAVRQTLLADPRINSIEQMEVILERDILHLSGYVVLVSSSQPYALDTRGTG